jgi:pilus assembly protein CpaB
MTRRIVAITVAIVLAALGAAGGLFLILSADQRAQDKLTDAVTVAVAKSRMSAGTTGARARSQGMVVLLRLPKANVPATALTDWGPAYDKLELTTNVAADQILLKGNFGTPSEVTSGLPIEDGKMAVTVQTGAPAQVAGYVQPGAQVAIFLTYAQVDQSGNKTGVEITKILLPRVDVLAVGSRSATGSTTNRTAGALLLTVAVSQADAERLIEGMNHGSLYLGLLNDSVDVKAGPGVNNKDGSNSSTPLFK